MFKDALLRLWSAASLTGSTSYLSTKSYDKGLAARDISIGNEPMELVIQVDVSATNVGTYKWDVLDDTVEALTSSPAVLNSRTILYSDLVAGSKHRIPIPAGASAQQFLGAKLTNTGGAITVTADIMPASQIEQIKNYASGSVVDTPTS